MALSKIIYQGSGKQTGEIIDHKEQAVHRDCLLFYKKTIFLVEF